MDNVRLSISTVNYVTIYEKLLISRNDQVDLRYLDTRQKVSDEPLDMIVALMEADKLNSLCVIREQTIVVLLSRSQVTLKEFLGLLYRLLSNVLYIALNKATKDDIQTLIQLGFQSPTIVSGKVTLYKTINPSPEFTQLELRRLEAYANKPFIKLNVRVVKDTLANLSEYVNSFDREVGGVLRVFAYDDEDKAIIRFNPQELIIGEAAEVPIPFDTLSFHTHPDLCYRTLGCYIGWPSSQDMIFLLQSYFSARPTLLHLVSTAEGIWAMQLTPVFQRILSYLRVTNREPCIQTIINLVLDKFTKLHDMRQLNVVPPLLRAKFKRDYETLVKIITLTDLFEMYPDLKSVCAGAMIEDGQLYSIVLTPWDQILTSNSDLDITIEYLRDLKHPVTLPVTYGEAAYNKIKSLPAAEVKMQVDLS
jgi:hypothetical protein